MTDPNRAPNWSLDAVCEEIESHDLTPEQEADLCGLILEELQARREKAAEYEESVSRAIEEHGEAYRRRMVEAGRGELLG